MGDGVADFVFILSEVHLEASSQVKGLQGPPVFRLKLWKKRIRPILGMAGEPAVRISAELHEDYHGNGSIRWSKIRDGLRNPVVQNAEILFFEAGENVAVLRDGDHVKGENGDINSNSDTGLRGFLSLSSERRRWGGWALWCLHFPLRSAGG